MTTTANQNREIHSFRTAISKRCNQQMKAEGDLLCEAGPSAKWPH